MSRFTFICEEGKSYLYPHDNNTKSSVIFSAVMLQDVVKHFELFLKGCGYEFTGHLDFVNDEEVTDE